MDKSLLIPNRSGHLSKVIHDLRSYGWNIDSIPSNGKFPRNGLNLILRANSQELKLRVFAYKVTGSGRNRPHERRIEITKTYQSGLTSLSGYQDIVLGIDVDTGKCVGVDSRRLRMGGSSHNASSFFDLEGLSVKAGELLINPRPVVSPLFPGGIEQHSFFEASRLSEYLFNQQDIHLGQYTSRGAFSGTLRKNIRPWPDITNYYQPIGDALVISSSANTRRSLPKVTPELLALVEEKNFAKLGRRKLTPAQLKEIMNLCDEVGVLGEQAVLTAERQRLRKLGYKDEANKVERVSLWSVGEGYDILSFEDDGVTKRYLEVKTTTRRGTIVDVSANEWKTAQKYGKNYYLVRVTDIMNSAKIFFIQDPISLESQGRVIKSSSGWKVDLRKEMKVTK